MDKPKPTIPDVVARFADYRQRPGNAAWGSLHVVLDDHNVSDDHVRGAVGRAREDGDAEGEALGGMLLRMTRTQRLKLPHAVHAHVVALGAPARRPEASKQKPSQSIVLVARGAAGEGPADSPPT